MPQHLIDRDPRVPAHRLIGGLVPPPRFDSVRFDTYRCDPQHPSQAEALETLRDFTARVGDDGGRGWLLRRRAGERPGGIYLDGGYGVGKTHLLASLWHAAPGPKLFATFVELTHLVGALGFASAVESLAEFKLVCVDEFELDDPGDTVLITSLLGRLADRGVWLAATSNTLLGRLGEGRFAAEDFQREIQALAARFAVRRIEGPDYRHRDRPDVPPPYSDDEVRRFAQARPGASVDHFVDVTRHLAGVHPSRYGVLLDGLDAVALTDVREITDQAVALRLVVLADRLYDRGLPIVASGLPLDRVFAPELLEGGYRKKYFRAISRLTALGRES
ncbi:MAG TPA: cell division protein ZapE [Nocardioidaceae bacterium]|nr:cell division protein ZapE [Nocardioidaceae bacterium]